MATTKQTAPGVSPDEQAQLASYVSGLRSKHHAYETSIEQARAAVDSAMTSNLTDLLYRMRDEDVS